MTAVLSWPGWDYIQMISAVVGLVAAAWFVVQVVRETGNDWRNNPFGRFLVQRKVVLACLFGYMIFSRTMQGSIVTPSTWVGQDAILAVLLSIFAAQTFVPYRLLMAAQRAHDKPPAQEAEHDGHR